VHLPVVGRIFRCSSFISAPLPPSDSRVGAGAGGMPRAAAPPARKVPFRKLLRVASVACGMQFWWALQLSLLTPYVQELGIPHAVAIFVWLCSPSSATSPTASRSRPPRWGAGGPSSPREARPPPFIAVIDSSPRGTAGPGRRHPKLNDGKLQLSPVATAAPPQPPELCFTARASRRWPLVSPGLSPTGPGGWASGQAERSKIWEGKEKLTWCGGTDEL
jgi:hypothetical protein